MGTLETKRLLLREWRPSDANNLFAYAGNPHVVFLARWKPHASREESLNLTRYFMDNPQCFAISLMETGHESDSCASIRIKTAADDHHANTVCHAIWKI